MTRRVRRAPHVISLWRDDVRMVQAAGRATAVPATSFLLDLLDQAGAWRSVPDLATALDVAEAALAVLLDGLQAHGIVELASETDGAPGAEAAGGAEPTPLAQWGAAASLFHHATRDVEFSRTTHEGGAKARPRRPPAELAPGEGEVVPLPLPRLPGTLADALCARRTHRQFAGTPLDLQDLATLLGVSSGVQAWVLADEGPLALKTSPSGGARHSLEAYVWARRVNGVRAGLYHYRPGQHVLAALPGTPPESVTAWLPTQDGYDQAAVVVVLASVLERVAWRYRSARAYRVVLVEAGHLGQTFCLAASALGLAPFCTAALADSAIERTLGLDAERQPAMYVLGAGPARPGAWQPHAGRPAPPLVATSLGLAMAARVTRRWSEPRRRPRRPRAR